MLWQLFDLIRSLNGFWKYQRYSGLLISVYDGANATDSMASLVQIKDTRYGQTHVAIYGPSWARDDWIVANSILSLADSMIEQPEAVPTSKVV